MNKTKIVVGFFLLLFTCHEIYGQISSLKIMLLSGNVQIGNSNHWKTGSVSEKLKNDDYVKISDNSYLVLVDEKSNKFLELKNEGTYKVSALWSKIQTTSAGLFKRLLNFLKDEIFSKTDSELLTVAAVKRSANALRLASPESSKVMANIIPLKWYKIDNGINYCLSISNRWGEKILTKSLSDTAFNFDYHTFNLKDSEYYFWKVSLCKDSNLVSNEGYFYIEKQELKNNIMDSLVTIEKMFPGDEFSPIKEFALANFLFSNGLNFDALTHFEKLASSPFFLEEYRKCYIKFLLSVSMIDKANTFMKTN